MKAELRVGITGTSEITVTKELLADHIGSGLVTVFSTAMMIAHMEGTAVATVQGCLDEGITTVGTMVNITHLAATPCGMKVRFEAELLEISPNGKGLTFRVTAHDEAGRIGEGTHGRVIVHREKFESRTQARGSEV